MNGLLFSIHIIILNLFIKKNYIMDEEDKKSLKEMTNACGLLS